MALNCTQCVLVQPKENAIEEENMKRKKGEEERERERERELQVDNSYNHYIGKN